VDGDEILVAWEKRVVGIPYLFIFYLFFFSEKKNKILESCQNLQKNDKKNNNKYVLFHFFVFVRSLALCDIYFLKNTKNSFFSLLVSVRPLASYDTHFQAI